MTLLFAGTAALVLALSAVHPPLASAATTITVNTTADEAQAGDGTCSLREAILYVNGTAEPDCAAAPASGVTNINLPAGTYRLAGQPLTLIGSATLSGAGATTTTVTAAGMSQVFIIRNGPTVAISDMTITGGLSGQQCAGECNVTDPVNGLPGGGIQNDGTLTLTRVIVTGNRTSPGANNANCTRLTGGCAGGNGGDGGGISNAGTLKIADSAITANSTGIGAAGTSGAPLTAGAPGSPGGSGGSGGSGAGIRNFQTLTITNSTIAGNTTGAGADGGHGGNGVNGGAGRNGGTAGAGGSGAGIDNTGRLVISGSTINGNATAMGGHGGTAGDGSNGSIGGDGGLGGGGGPGGGIASSADTTISNSTIVGNSAANAGGSGFGGNPNGGFPGTLLGANGGGLDQLAMGAVLTHVTIASNRAPGTGGGIDGDGGTVTAGNSIIAGNTAGAEGPNCDGVLTDQGGNVEFGGSSCPAGFLRADPRLAQLGSNGGSTQTVALQPGSAAIHHVRTCVLTVDQRGVGRPVGSACDSGAYQVAPPSLSGIGVSGVTTSGATIAASANPNLQDTSVVINYGPTTSYGSSTPASDLGAGNTPVTFSSALTGLAAATTYHFDIVATNADGRTTSSDGVFTTLAPLAASIAGATTAGPTLSLTIACTGGSGPGMCAGTIGLSAKGPTKHRHARLLTVAGGGYSVASGGSVTVALRLNRQGQTMLSQHYTLVSTVSLGGTTQLSRLVTFRYPLIKSPISYTWAFAPSGASKATELTVTRIPHGGNVTVICHGGGCPFATRRFVPHRGQVILAPTFAHSSLRPGAKVVVEVLAPNQVGKVETFVIRRGMGPVVSRACRPPGTSRPARCV